MNPRSFQLFDQYYISRQISKLCLHFYRDCHIDLTRIFQFNIYQLNQQEYEQLTYRRGFSCRKCLGRVPISNIYSKYQNVKIYYILHFITKCVSLDDPFGNKSSKCNKLFSISCFQCYDLRIMLKFIFCDVCASYCVQDSIICLNVTLIFIDLLSQNMCNKLIEEVFMP